VTSGAGGVARPWKGGGQWSFRPRASIGVLKPSGTTSGSHGSGPIEPSSPPAPATSWQVFHTFATWQDWAFDHCGWHRADDLVKVNEDFVGQPLVRLQITTDLAEFCHRHYHRMPHQYHRDPWPRARDYVRRFDPPWVPA
jgi:hypothetical protein